MRNRAPSPAPFGLADALGTIARDRRGLLGALIIKPAPSALDPLLTAERSRHLRRQLIAAAITEALVLFAVELAGVLDHLARQPLVVEVVNHCRSRRWEPRRRAQTPNVHGSDSRVWSTDHVEHGRCRETGPSKRRPRRPGPQRRG